MEDESTIVLAQFEVLGFEDRVRAIGLEELHNQYNELVGIVMTQTAGRVVVAPIPAGDGGLALAGCYCSLDSTFFADTILIWSKPYRLPVVESFLGSMNLLFCEALTRGLPLRGCIAFGEAIMDGEKGDFSGSPVVEAHSGVAAQKWLGVSMGPSILTYPWIGSLRQVQPYCEHTFKGSEHRVAGWVLDWPRKWRESYEPEARASAEATLSGLQSLSGVMPYCESAAAFCRYSVSKSSWWEDANWGEIEIAGHVVPEPYGGGE